ncbi:MAG: hypothetical protein KatS3mg129_1458 [Leptospiraceae bacterium]|nr:MAG: hypothetical protein KatS3mg129_1458 [Leptospiraceae bacterium]
MKEFVYHVSEEEKIPLIINRILSNPDDQFVIFSKDKKTIMNLFDYCKKYQILYSHLYSENTGIAFKNYNEKKSKVFFISDELLETKNFFIPSTNQIIHFDIPSHPLIYQKRNDIIKNINNLRLIHLYCTEKEYQDFKAIEVYFDKKIQVGKVLDKDLKLPKMVHKTKKTIQKKSVKKSKTYKQQKHYHKTTIPEKETKIGLWIKIKNWFIQLFRKTK